MDVTTHRPRLLFLSHVLPFPPDSGVAIRTYNVLRILSRAFDVTALCFYRARAVHAGRGIDENLAALRELARVEAFPIPQEHSRFRLAFDHLRSLATGRAYTVYAYRSQAFRDRVEGLLTREDFDLVHVDSLDLCAYLPMLSHLPVVCVHHNVESRLLRRRAAKESARFARWYVLHQAKLLEREERWWCGQVTLNVTVSDDDRRELERIAPDSRCVVVPNGVDVTEYQPATSVGTSITFVGGMEWFPNVDALKHFCTEILPRLRARGVSAPVRWVGRASPDERREYRERFGVELTGYLDDIRPALREAACVIAPLRIGGGTRLKITTAWAMGKAIVSSSIGCEGLAAEDGENILVRDTPEAFAEAIHVLLRDERLRMHVESGARRTALERYSWDVIAEAMVLRYQSLLSPVAM